MNGRLKGSLNRRLKGSLNLRFNGSFNNSLNGKGKGKGNSNALALFHFWPLRRRSHWVKALTVRLRGNAAHVALPCVRHARRRRNKAQSVFTSTSVASSKSVGDSNCFSMKSNMAGLTSNENVMPLLTLRSSTRARRSACGALT